MDWWPGTGDDRRLSIEGGLKKYRIWGKNLKKRAASKESDSFNENGSPIRLKAIPLENRIGLRVSIRIAESRLLAILLGDSNRPITVSW